LIGSDGATHCGTIAAAGELTQIKRGHLHPVSFAAALSAHFNRGLDDPMVRIPHNAFVFVGDGKKALVLRNEGDAQFVNLKTERVFTDANPATHEQGTDRPGRAFSSVGGVRSSVGQTDWHKLEEHRFAEQAAAALERIVRERGVEALVVVAPPRALADLRKAFHPDVKKKIVAEIDKDLTKHPIDQIEKHLASG
jgi:protein required for attachment to host cells